MSERLTAAVIGAGAIGARMDTPGTQTPMTHAGGYAAAGFRLVGLVDPAADVAEVARLWSCPAFSRVEDLAAVSPDVISVATPSEVQGQVLRAVMTLRPRVVIAEKPLAHSMAEAQHIVALYAEAGIALIVNYTRRFTPVWRGLAPCTAMSATFRYAKGLRHNGTHALDLCRMLFGDCVDARVLARNTDFWPDDPTVSAFLRFERCPEVFLQGMDERCFTFFEADIIAPDWRLIVDKDGRRARRFTVRDGVGIPPGRRLVETGTEDTGVSQAMLTLMAHARDVARGAPPWCSGVDALAAQQITEALRP